MVLIWFGTPTLVKATITILSAFLAHRNFVAVLDFNQQPALAAQVPLKVKEMNAQDTSNCLAAATYLHELVHDVREIVPALLDHAAVNMKEMKGKNLRLAVPTIIWACARWENRKDDMFAEAFTLLGSGQTCSSLTDWSVCALMWSVETLDLKNRFMEFHQKLKKELRRRHLSKADVERSQHGTFPRKTSRVEPF